MDPWRTKTAVDRARETSSDPAFRRQKASDNSEPVLRRPKHREQFVPRPRLLARGESLARASGTLPMLCARIPAVRASYWGRNRIYCPSSTARLFVPSVSLVLRKDLFV